MLLEDRHHLGVLILDVDEGSHRVNLLNFQTQLLSQCGFLLWHRFGVFSNQGTDGRGDSTSVLSPPSSQPLEVLEAFARTPCLFYLYSLSHHLKNLKLLEVGFHDMES